MSTNLLSIILTRAEALDLVGSLEAHIDNCRAVAHPSASVRRGIISLEKLHKNIDEQVKTTDDA